MHRFALVGAGFMGCQHAENLASQRGIDFALVYDVDQSRARAVAEQYGARAAGEIAEVFDPEQIDAVLIASATDTHAEHLRRAADAGVAALCEKPIDQDLDRAAEVAGYVVARTGRTMIDFNRRFDRDYVELKAVVDRGEIGEIALIQFTSRGPDLPPLDYVRVSGGQMRDQAVHFFDLTRWVSGLDPVQVFATGTALADPRFAQYGDVDTSVISLRLPTGALVQIDCTRRTGYGYDERIEVLGSDGMVQARRHRTGAVSRYSVGKVVEDGLHPGWFERVRPTYAAALSHFVRALDGEESFTPSLDDGLRAAAIAEAATRSLESGKSETIAYPALGTLGYPGA